MKKIVTYKLHNGSVPYFISDGGYWVDPISPYTFVGITEDDTDCYVPLTLLELTPAELTAKVVSYTITDIDGNVLTTQEKEAMIASWLTQKGF